MVIGKIFLLVGFFYKVLPPTWKGIKWWAELIDKTYEPLRPKIWKLHNRLCGWSGVVMLLIYAGILRSEAQGETGFFQIYYACGSSLMLLSAGVFAVAQNRVWKRGDYFSRPVKEGPLDGLV